MTKISDVYKFVQSRFSESKGSNNERASLYLTGKFQVVYGEYSKLFRISVAQILYLH